jgi:histidinol-phosphate aminotransferase
MGDSSLRVSEGIQRITPYVPGKPIQDLEQEYGIKGAIKLASNENPLGPSPRAVEAMRQVLTTIHQYPDADSRILKAKLAQRYNIPQECFVPANGSNEIIELTLRVFLRPGLEVIMPDPCFSLYLKFTQAMDGVPVPVPLRDFRVDLQAMARRVTTKTRVIFITNPNNPTGTVVSKGEFEKFLAVVPETAVIVMDEAYGEFVSDPDTPQGREYLQGPPWIITLRTFSKVYGLAGLRIGYGLAPQELTHYLNKVRQPFNVSAVAQAAASAALDDEVHFQETLRVIREGRSFLTQEFQRLGIAYVPSESNFIMIHVGTDCDPMYEGLLRQGVIVRPLKSFGYPEHLRITVGTHEENRRFIATFSQLISRPTR